jgi:hypothetical protein
VQEELRSRLFTLQLELIEGGHRVTSAWKMLREIAENPKYKANEVARVIMDYELAAQHLSEV